MGPGSTLSVKNPCVEVRANFFSEDLITNRWARSSMVVQEIQTIRLSSSPTPDSQVYLLRGFTMSAHVLLNLLNELGKRDKMRGLPSILSLFRD